jgi:hypothetical protein
MKPNETLSEGTANIVRSCTRPFLTLFSLVAVVMFNINGIDPPAGFEAMVYGMVGWWFVDRSLLKRKDKK